MGRNVSARVASNFAYGINPSRSWLDISWAAFLRCEALDRGRAPRPGAGYTCNPTWPLQSQRKLWRIHYFVGPAQRNQIMRQEASTRKLQLALHPGGKQLSPTRGDSSAGVVVHNSRSWVIIGGRRLKISSTRRAESFWGSAGK